MPRELSEASLTELVRPGDTVFVAGGTGEPTAILTVWRQARCLDEVTLVGLQVPGFNALSPEEFGVGCRFRTNFLAPTLRAAFSRCLVDLLPMHHTEFYQWLANNGSVSLAVFQCSPPDAHGRCSLGPCADLLPALLARGDIRLMAQINPHLPSCLDGISVDFNRLHGTYFAETELPEWRTSTAESDDAIADNAASLIDDGATVQIGIGRLPDQVLSRLTKRRHLKLHGGAVSAAGLRLIHDGAVDQIVAGIALGERSFYAKVVATPGVSFRPVPITHGPDGLAGINRFIAINAALEVDLFGQANCEIAGGRLVSAFAGINDFLRAARVSPDGRSVLMLPARSASASASRVVVRIGEPGLVSVQRGDVDTVVTEHGIADLRGLDMEERAAALIHVAAPEFRESLAAEWTKLRSRLT